MQYLVQQKNNRMISVHFPRQTIQRHSNPKKLKLTNKTFYEDLQDLLELTPKKDIFIIGEWNAKVGSQEISGVIGKGLGVQNEAGQKLTEFCQENTVVIANTFFQQHKK